MAGELGRRTPDGVATSVGAAAVVDVLEAGAGGRVGRGRVRAFVTELAESARTMP
jgi:hypothetical protein